MMINFSKEQASSRLTDWCNRSRKITAQLEGERPIKLTPRESSKLAQTMLEKDCLVNACVTEGCKVPEIAFVIFKGVFKGKKVSMLFKQNKGYL